jgi:DNA-binding response OmpR family regulator
MSGVRKRILVVDDDHDFSESVTAFLRAHGYDVTQAYDGREGLEMARRHAPDLILMDVMMNERTEGFFTVQQVRRDRGLEHVPVFVVSSLYQDVPGFSILPGRSWMGHDEFFPKPIELDRLLAKIEEHVSVGTEAL